METIYLLVSYWPNDMHAGKNVETYLGYFTDKEKAETRAIELSNKYPSNKYPNSEKYFVRSVKPAE